MIYIHVPFCHRKCTYCAFYSKPLGTEGASAYVDALLAEMELRKGEQAHPIRTIYFGGGTPSILPIGQLDRIVDALYECFDLSQVEEVTIECNPEDLTPDYLQGLKNIGLVNRLSIGIQSLDDDVLRLIGRRHTAQQALEAVENAHRAGFDNISVDFIYGIKAINAPNALSALNALKELVTHISAYSLTVEPGTALAVQVGQGRVTLPDEDEVVRQYHALHWQLTEAGFHQYEVSNYARPGYESRHNSRYWDRTSYLGLGPAAHSFDGLHRRWNHGNIEEYISSYSRLSRFSRDFRLFGLPFEEETLTAADAFNELLMTALRTVHGLPVAAVPEGQKERLHRLMQPYVNCGWIVMKDGCYSPTTEGLLHADGMAVSLFDT